MRRLTREREGMTTPRGRRIRLASAEQARRAPGAGDRGPICRPGRREYRWTNAGTEIDRRATKGAARSECEPRSIGIPFTWLHQETPRDRSRSRRETLLAS